MKRIRIPQKTAVPTDQVKKLWGNIKYGYLHFKIK